MKKNVLLILSMLVVGGLAQAQSYYYLSYGSGSGNPGGVNGEIDNVNPTAAGWSQIVSSGQSTPVYSAAQVIPFTFMFNGSPVSSFKAASSGYITFDALAAGTPMTNAEALPSANLPDMSVAIWGMETSGPNDAVTMKTFGTAPNRQQWIRFMSMTTPGQTASFTYWSIVLEETTNNIYVVEQYAGASSGSYVSPSHSIGVQIDGSTAVQVVGSPVIKHTGSSNGTGADDNLYYAFMYGTQPMYDLSIYSNTTAGTIKSGTNVNFTGMMRNLGSEAVTSMTLHYTIDGGAEVTEDVTGINIAANGGTYSYSHPTAFTPPAPGVVHDVEVWASNINGNPDENMANDKVAFDFLSNEGVTTTKHVIIDEGSGAWCGHCPDAIPYLNQIRDAFGDQVIIASHHDDAGAGPAGDRWVNPQSDALHAAYGGFFPYGVVDRKLFDGSQTPTLRRDQWYNSVQERLNETCPVEVSITNKNWNPTTRQITFTVEAKFVDYAYNPGGELRIGAYVIEDNVRGVGQGYDQVVYSPYTGNPNHMFYNYPDPMVGYIHPDVVRGLPSGTFGSANSISDAPAMKDKTYTMDYTFTLPAMQNFTIPSTSRFEPKGDIVGFNKPADVKLVGFVAYYSDDVNNREILNAFEEPLFNVANTVENINNDAFGISNVYPNPTSGYTSVTFSLPTTSNVTVSVMNSVGQKVKDVRVDTFAAGDHKIVFDAADLETGVYFVKLEGENGQSSMSKFVVM